MEVDKLLPVGFYSADGTPHAIGRKLLALTAPHPHPDEDAILGYLAAAKCITACSAVAPDIVDPSLPIRLDMDIHTDVVWQWPAYLHYYVINYHARLPEQFVEHMRLNNWTPPDLDLNALLDRKAVVYLF